MRVVLMTEEGFESKTQESETLNPGKMIRPSSKLFIACHAGVSLVEDETDDEKETPSNVT